MSENTELELKLKNIIIGYRCPVCYGSVTAPAGALSLSGQFKRLKCSCGESAMTIENLSNGSIRFTVPCPICPELHTFTISSEDFFSRELFIFGCPISDVELCYIGRKDLVESAMEAGYNELLKLFSYILDEKNENNDTEAGQELLKGELAKMRSTDTTGSGGLFLAGTTLYDMANFLLCELRDDGKIECKCGGGEDSYGFELLDDEEDSVRFYCKDCGASAVYPASELFYNDGNFRIEKIYLF